MLPLLPAFESPPSSVILDLDGTTLDSTTTLRPRTAAAMTGILDAGIPIVIATARAIRSAAAILGPSLIARCTIVHLNGAVIHAGTDLRRPAAKQVIAPDDVRAIVEIAERCLPGERLVIEIDGWEFGSNRHLDPAALWATNRATPEMVLSVSDSLRAAVPKLSVTAKVDVAAFIEEVTRRLGGRISVLSDRFVPGYVQLVEPNTSKEAGTAIALGLVRAGLRLEDALAFGDDLSDRGLLKSARYGVAMANGHPDVLRVTRHATLSNDQDGVAVALELLLRVLSSR